MSGLETDFFQYVQTSSGNIAFHPNGSLVIKSVGQEDEGYYRCEVQNGVGEMSKTIVLDVQGKTLFTIMMDLCKAGLSFQFLSTLKSIQ